MILSNDDVNVGKVRGRVTEELPEAEALSPRIVLGSSWATRCVMTSQGKMAALVSAAAPLQRRSEDNHGVLYLFV